MHWKDYRLYTSRESNKVLAAITINEPTKDNSGVYALIFGKAGQRVSGNGSTKENLKEAKKWVEANI